MYCDLHTAAMLADWQRGDVAPDEARVKAIEHPLLCLSLVRSEKQQSKLSSCRSNR